MTIRRLALAIGATTLLGAGFTLAYTHPEILKGAFGPSAPSREHAAVEDHAFVPDALTPAELKLRLDNGERIVLGDVRGQASFDAKHITGARSMPASEIETWGPKLLPEELVVFYCS